MLWKRPLVKPSLLAYQVVLEQLVSLGDHLGRVQCPCIESLPGKCSR